MRRRQTSPEFDTAALSISRGNGKSTLAGEIGTRLLTPGDSLFERGKESVIVAGSLEQGRIVFRVIRKIIEERGQASKYRFADSLTRIQITHKATKTAVMVRGANARNMMGLLDTPYVIGDEPGSWKVTDGELMWDAIATAQGKPGSSLKAVLIGTLAPARSGWWYELVERGSSASTYVQRLQGDRETWDRWPTILKANPLARIDATFRKKLLEERDEARSDTRLKARFLSYRLNLPTADESETLLTVEDWKIAMGRNVSSPDGSPIVAVDLGGGRAWSAAVAIWPSGLVDAIGLAPGVPDLGAQEKRDRVPSQTYSRLFESGSLRLADGLQVQPPAMLWAFAQERWGMPTGHCV